MAGPHLASPNGTATAAVAHVSLELRKQQLAETLRKKVEQGYVVESQTDTEAILLSKGRRGKWFGLAHGGHDTRQTISIDGQGRAITRSL